MANIQPKPLDYKNLTIGSFIGGSFIAGYRSFFTLFLLQLLYFLALVFVGVIAALLRGNRIAAVSVGAVLALLLMGVFWVSSLRLIRGHIEGKNLSIFSALRSVGGESVAIYVVALLMSVPISLVSLCLYLANLDSLGVTIALNVVNLLLLVFVSFAIPAMVITGKGIWESFKYSFYLVWGNYLKTIGYYLLLTFFSIGVYVLFILTWYAGFFLTALAIGLATKLMTGNVLYFYVLGGLVYLVFALISMFFASFMSAFSTGGYLLLFLNLEAKIEAEVEAAHEVQKKLEKTMPPSGIRAAKQEAYITESEKFYKSLFDEEDEGRNVPGEMPTLVVDLTPEEHKDMEKTLRRRKKEIEENFRKTHEIDLEKTVTLSQGDFDFEVEKTEFLPSQDIGEAKDPLPDAVPQPRMRVVTMPPMPPEMTKKKEEDKEN